MKLSKQIGDRRYNWTTKEAALTRAFTMWGIFRESGGFMVAYMYDRKAAVKHAKSIANLYGEQMVIFKLPSTAWKTR